MSSSNLVSISYEKETVYGVKNLPITGVSLKKPRFTDESLSGTPATTESQELRTDRMSSGQVVTGLEVGGGINFELSKDVFFDDWFEAALMSTWVAAAEVDVDVTLVPDGADDQLAVLTLSSNLAGLAVGDLLQIRPDTSSVPKFVVSIISIDTPDTVFTVATTRGQAAMAAEAMHVARPSYVEIGSTITSFVVGKAYKDVTHLATSDEHSQTYLGSLVSGFSINAAYGEIITGSFSTNANGYLQENPSYEQQVVTGGGAVGTAGTTNPINASIDIPLVIAGGVATDFCIENLSVELDNGLTPQNCLGKIAPIRYDLGTAAISISASIYLSDTSYDTFMPAKLTQVPISMVYVAENTEGGYAFSLPAVQLSFPDPSAGGQNQPTTLEATGSAKVGANGQSALRVYRLVA